MRTYDPGDVTTRRPAQHLVSGSGLVHASGKGGAGNRGQHIGPYQLTSAGLQLLPEELRSVCVEECIPDVSVSRYPHHLHEACTGSTIVEVAPVHPMACKGLSLFQPKGLCQCYTPARYAGNISETLYKG